MTCSLVRSLLDDYADQELAPETETALQKHLEECSSCRAEYGQLRSLTTALSGLASPEPPDAYWSEVSDLILARTVEIGAPVDMPTEAVTQARERSALHRSALALAASLAIFATSLWYGLSGPIVAPVLSEGDRPGSVSSTYATAVSTISADEEELIAGSMLLVGTPGMFASPAEMAGLLGLDRIR